MVRSHTGMVAKGRPAGKKGDPPETRTETRTKRSTRATDTLTEEIPVVTLLVKTYRTCIVLYRIQRYEYMYHIPRFLCSLSPQRYTLLNGFQNRQKHGSHFIYAPHPTNRKMGAPSVQSTGRAPRPTGRERLVNVPKAKRQHKRKTGAKTARTLGYYPNPFQNIRF